MDADQLSRPGSLANQLRNASFDQFQLPARATQGSQRAADRGPSARSETWSYIKRRTSQVVGGGLWQILPREEALAGATAERYPLDALFRHYSLGVQGPPQCLSPILEPVIKADLIYICGDLEITSRLQKQFHKPRGSSLVGLMA